MRIPASIFLVAIVCLLLFATGCEKYDDCLGDCTVLQGRITTAGGTESLKGVPLTVVWTGPGGLFPGVKREKAAGKTDAQGFYRFSFFLKKDELEGGSLSIEYSVDESKYLIFDSRPAAIHPDFNGRQKRDTTVTTDFILPRKAWLQARVSRFPEYPDVFHSVFTFKNGTPGRLNWEVRTSWTPPHAEHPIELPGDQPIQVTTIRKRNGVETVEHDSLRIPAGQTLAYDAIF